MKGSSWNSCYLKINGRGDHVQGMTAVRESMLLSLVAIGVGKATNLLPDDSILFCMAEIRRLNVL